MKYLVIGNQAIMASEHKAQMDFLLRTKEWVNTKLADGTLDCAYSFPAGGGFFIFNADSNEGLTKLLVDFPLRPLTEFEIHALCDFNVATDMVVDSIKDLV